MKKGSLVQVMAEWLRLSAWINQNGVPQPSLDMDANRLALPDRMENGDVESSEDVPF